jgi:predicted transcriptional regulator
MTKVLISMPDELVARIDRAAKARKTSRSRFIQEAAEHELGWPGSDAIEVAVKAAREALEPDGRYESTDLIRRDRDERDANRH